MIEGVAVRPLTVIPDERGAVMHMVKRTDASFHGFGEVYFSSLSPRSRKPWRRQRESTSQLAVPIGHVRFILFDERPASATAGSLTEVELGENNYHLLTIPPMVWFALQSLSDTHSLVANCATEPHDPSLVEREDFHTARIPYLWHD
jgi:dTDP-4-dehydrorhamnose 3,5-epimerase